MSTRLLAAVAGTLVATHALAGVISDASFFDSIPSTLIDFETDGAGSPLTLVDGQISLMPGAEYAALGVTFSPNIYWVNDQSSVFDTAQSLGGSLDHAIPSSQVNAFTMSFNVPVRSFGFWVVSNTAFADPVFVARDASNNILETVTFTGGLVDGVVTSANVTAAYGFMGAYSATPIASVTITKGAALFDDLRFSSTVPAPGVIPAGLLVLTIAQRRRR